MPKYRDLAYLCCWFLVWFPFGQEHTHRLFRFPEICWGFGQWILRESLESMCSLLLFGKLFSILGSMCELWFSNLYASWHVWWGDSLAKLLWQWVPSPCVGAGLVGGFNLPAASWGPWPAPYPPRGLSRDPREVGTKEGNIFLLESLYYFACSIIHLFKVYI